jgi:hypothetical protein
VNTVAYPELPKASRRTKLHGFRTNDLLHVASALLHAV